MTASEVVLRPPTEHDDLDALMAGAPLFAGRRQLPQAVEAHSGNEHVVACLGHKTVGYAYCILVPLKAGGRASARVWVLAAVRGRGVGSALWSAVLATARKA
jgi:GNAT superfamily N-acetyltransferase